MAKAGFEPHPSECDNCIANQQPAILHLRYSLQPLGEVFKISGTSGLTQSR